MVTLTDTLVLIGMFALRIGVPLGIVLIVGYLLKRLDRRWEEQAWLEQGKAVPQAEPKKQPVAPASTPEQTLKRDLPQGQSPLNPAAHRWPQPGLAASKPCWETKACSESKKSACAASQHPEMACWQARFGVEGHIPESCVACEIFQHYPAN